MNVSKIGVEVSKLLVANDRQAYLVGECVMELVVDGEITSRLEIATDANITELFTIFSENPDYTIVYTTNDKLVVRAKDVFDAFTISVYKTIYDGSAKIVDEYLFSKGMNMHSMAYDAIKEELIDPLNVQEDIKAQVVRVNSEFSFIHDTRLIFKLAYVCAKLGYKLDGKSAMLAAKSSYLVDYMPATAIRDELDKYFTDLTRPSAALRVLNSIGVLKRILPELACSKGYKTTFTDIVDLYNHTLRLIDIIPKGRPLVRWIALFHDLGKMRSCEGYGTANVKFIQYRDQSAKVAMEVMGRLHFSTQEIFTVERVVKNECLMHHSSNEDLLAFIDRVGPSNIPDALLLEASHKLCGAYDFETTRKWLAAFRGRIHYLMVKEERFKIKDLRRTYWGYTC